MQGGSSANRLGQEAHHLGRCLDKHCHFMKFILRYRKSDRCLYVSLARNQAPSPPLTLLRRKAGGLRRLFIRDKQEKQLAQLLSFSVTGISDRQRQTQCDCYTCYFLFSKNLNHFSDFLLKEENTPGLKGNVVFLYCHTHQMLPYEEARLIIAKLTQ